MQIDVLTLFPEMFQGVLSSSIIGRAIARDILRVRLTNFRDFAHNKHNQVDDTPFGGGAGMVLKPEPIYRAIEHIKGENETLSHRRVIALDPVGELFTQDKAKELATFDQIILVCGHYEGFDARIYDIIDERVSIGDYVLTGGELPAMIVLDATARMLEGVLGDNTSAKTDSFFDGLLGYPQYTRPREFAGKSVPEVLFSGNHKKIAKWRREKALEATLKYRPDLLDSADLSPADREFLKGCGFF